MSENKEEFCFELEDKDYNLYIEYRPGITGNETCEIGTSDNWCAYCKDVSYSELIEFSKAVNNVIKMMEENMKED